MIEKLSGMGLETKPSRYFARLAQGSLGTACQWAALELADANLYTTKTWLVESLVRSEFADALNLAEALLVEAKRIATIWVGIDKTTSKTDINRRVMGTLVRVIVSLLQDVMKRSVDPASEVVNFDQPGQIEALATRFDAEQAAEKISDGYRALRWIESSVNEKLIFEQFLLSLADSDRMRASR